MSLPLTNYLYRFYNMRFVMVNVNGQDEVERFQGTTTLNAGIQVKWFADVDAARAWLKSK